ncbi:PP2C family protein-serine/threonine phosphatase [Gimesia fumaroli]|uniref:Serine/threonine phosphatase stp n=1 Tax=Gimesia fumaroli TaxID=2527976 RepID=A0A518I9H9_9PLAN|nr:protein phosphatase 2C domain-containing protein [Gimesia fumaroli]QDV49765.1 Serine/threonine phosphatase stp [Gimesia fumaroli]
MTGKMDCYGLTQTGSKQLQNQDQFLIADLEKSMRIHLSSLSLDNHSRVFGNSQAKLLMVAEGTGNPETGDLASRLATDSITRYFLNNMPWFLQWDEESDDDMCDALINAFEQCQQRMESDVQEHPERAGMGASLTLAYMVWPQLYVVHTGHTRCFLYRQSNLHQLTRDHSLAERLVTNGTLEADEVPEIWKNLLLNSIGGDGDSVLNPDICKMQIQMGDALLLCTDGLTKHVPDSVISEILGQDTMANDTCVSLLNEVKDRGGTDNTTVVVARFLDLGDQDVAMIDSLDVETGNTQPTPKAKILKPKQKPIAGKRNG